MDVCSLSYRHHRVNFTISTFTEISYLGNKIALLSLNINTKYIKSQTDTRSWPAGEPLPRDYPMNAGIWCSSLPGLAQPKTSHLSISHIWACFHISPPATTSTLPFNTLPFNNDDGMRSEFKRCDVVWIRYVFFLLVLFSIIINDLFFIQVHLNSALTCFLPPPP